MNDVTQILQQIDAGDPSAADQLLPLVYAELKKLAAARMRREDPDHTLQATALVHEAYARLVQNPDPQQWSGRGHFFAASAEAMRRILVESARRKQTQRRGGQLRRQDLDLTLLVAPGLDGKLIELDEALDELAQEDAKASELVKLRYFAGLTIPEAAQILGVSPRKADQMWVYARAWLRRCMDG